MTRSGATWDSAYVGPPPPWDIGRPQPAVLRLADAGAFRGRVLDAGCGTGENALELARRGLETWGVDSASRAIEKARAKAIERGVDVTFVVGDALDLGRLGGTFDSVLTAASSTRSTMTIERAMSRAWPPPSRTVGSSTCSASASWSRGAVAPGASHKPS